MYRDLDSFISGGAELTLSPLPATLANSVMQELSIPEWNSLPAEVMDQQSERGVYGQSRLFFIIIVIVIYIYFLFFCSTSICGNE